MTQPTVAALVANDVRFTELLEDFLQDYVRFDKADCIPDVALAIACYEIEPTSANKFEVAGITHRNKIERIWKLLGQFKNSPAYLALVAEYTPESVTSEQLSVVSKPAIVATGTTAKAIATPSTVKVIKMTREDGSFEIFTKENYRGFVERAYLIRTHGVYLEKGSKWELIDQVDIPTPVKPDSQKSASETTVLAKTTSSKPKTPKAPKQAKVTPKLPMPTVASLEELQSWDRKKTVDAFKALKSNYPVDFKDVRANAATVVLKTQLAGMLLFQGYVEPTKATKGRKKSSSTPATEVALAMPEGLSWAQVKVMPYRELQKICKALRFNGKYEGNIGGKGIDKDHLRNAIATALGLEAEKGVEVTYTKTMNEDAFINKYCPNWAEIKKQKQLERQATQMIKESYEVTLAAN
jgi:hypothetical protein